MRRVSLAFGIVVLLSPVALFDCGRSSPVSADASPVSSAAETPSSSQSGPAAALPSATALPGSVLVAPLSSPGAAGAAAAVGVLGAPCSPGKDSIACTANGVAAATCAGGTWRMLELCRGPGRCKGVGSALTCDTGLPQPGDACVAAASESQCRNAHEAMACRGGRWMVSPCEPGKLCFRANGKGHAGCK